MFSRRTFIKAGAIAAGSLYLPESLLAQDRQEKACILVWLGGGISATEFINPIPDAPVEYRGVAGAITTKTGYQIGADFPLLAGISDRFTTVRSFNHKDGNHSSATHWLLTGHSNLTGGESSPQKEPSYGSIVSKILGENNPEGVPTYVKVNPIQYDDAAWLGSKFTGFDNDEQGIKNLKLNIPESSFKRRLEMANAIEKSAGNTVGPMKEWTELRNTASKVVVGSAAKAFDLTLEAPGWVRSYDIEKSGFGRSMLLARRLVEAGTRFVTLHHGGWDMHNTIAKDFPARAAEVDIHLTNLILDLESKGLLKSTMIVVASEFSRTPKINPQAGRDHWPGINSLILAGGDYGGNLIGTTDSTASTVTSQPFDPSDLAFTILNHFDVRKGDKTIDNQGRPRYFIEEQARLIV